ncbi:putative disease resistance protein RGA3 [Spinacia oleracea]|uniref:Disease resistance protein RGA3 n=1 Tax=Spinacia oleracea TaxID=3562 RepID=A0A9R0JYR3_SPIOL|nr:putative disease resistance protein RGA3 [Spinacia oleracea]
MSDPVSLLAGPIITKIIELGFSFGKNKYDQLYGVEGEMEKLMSNLSSIKAVLNDAERCCSDSKSEQLVDWLSKLRDASLDVEDILETYAIEASIIQKQRLTTPFAWLSSRSDAANKIKKMVTRMDIISQEKTNFHFRPGDYGGTDWTPQGNRIGLREMSYLRDTSDIVGREEEREEVVSWLLKEEEEEEEEEEEDEAGNNRRVPVLPIIGMGGLGKTTLAQLVYNDERVYKKLDDVCHFKVAMWINVSVDSSVDKILREMVEILTEMRHDMIPRSSIQSRILEVLDGKRFLLVLDDVWVEKLDWEPIHDFLKLCPKGSKILVTSRNGNVTKIMGASHTHTLGQLPEERCWDLFAKRAFPDGAYSTDLEEIGREITRRCNCLPLAVKAMAGLLRGDNDVSKWQRILKNGIWESEQSNLGNGIPNILPALKLSYDHLPSQLKQCFAYCYIFPKGHMFDKYHLVKLWIVEGYIQLTGENKLEETGSDYFDELLTRSFFQILDIDNKVRYKMHDLIHDLAKSVSSCCQRIEENKSYSIQHTSRHVSFHCKDVQKPAAEILKAKKLRTLLLPISYARDFGLALDKMFRALRYMRVLDLSSTNIIDLPKSIGQLKLLRYLDLSRTEIRLLPNTVCNLYNLQILKLLGCLWLLELPKDLGNLQNLRYLELDEMFWYKCSKLPPNIGGLTNLHNFHSFYVRQESGYGIEELKSMNSLEGTLHISMLENSADAKAAELKQKEGITKLTLEWSKQDASLQNQTVQEIVLEDLEPYQSLRELHIHQYKGSRFSSWMGNGMLQNLYKISLNHCVSCRILSVGPLPHLQELRIKGMLELSEWPETLYPSLRSLRISKCPQLRELPRIFPNLRVMKINHCDVLKALPVMPTVMFLILSNNALLEEWREVTMHIVTRNHGGGDVRVQRHSFMDLLELKIVNCPRLQEMPTLFSPQKLQISGCILRTLPQHNQRLQCLELDKCNGSSLIDAIQSTDSLYSLIISNFTNLDTLPKLPHLPRLQSLYIHNCQDLVTLSHENSTLRNLTSLKLLSISGCKKLEAFPEEGLPTSIECLSIENCLNLKSFPTPNYLSSITSLRDLYLEDCPKLKSIAEDGLPSSLQHLRIRGCSLLTQQFNKDAGGKYWKMISHVTDLELESIKNHQPKPILGPRKGYLACFTRK